MADQLQGPNVSVTLFPDAMRAGAEVGNAVKTPLQAIAEGITAGVKNYEAVQTTDLAQEQTRLENEYKKTQIEAAPIELELKRQQAEAYRLKVEEDKLKQEEALKTQQDALDAKKAELENKKVKFSQDTELRNKKQDLTDRWDNASGDLERKELLFGRGPNGNYNDVFAANPNLYRQYGATIAGSFNEAERSQFDTTVKTKAIGDVYDKLKKDYEPKAQIAESELMNNDEYKDALTSSGTTPSESMQWKAVPAGTYEVGEDGKMKFGKDGKPVTKPVDTAVKNFDFFDPTGKRVAANASKDFAKAFNTHKNIQNILHDVYKKRDIENATKGQPTSFQELDAALDAKKKSSSIGQPTPSVTPTPTEGTAPPTKEEIAQTEKESQYTVKPLRSSQASALVFSTDTKTPKGGFNFATNPSAYKTAQTIIGLPEKQFTSVKPQVQAILQTLEEPKKGWFGGFSEEQNDTLVNAKQSITARMAKIDFEGNEAVRKEYTPLAVEQHNADVQAFRNALMGHAVPLAGNLAVEYYLKNRDFQTMIKVSTPEELFHVRNQKKYDSAVQGMILAFNSKAEAHRKARTASGMLPTKQQKAFE